MPSAVIPPTIITARIAATPHATRFGFCFAIYFMEPLLK